jgi:hypothetical protein
MTIKAISNSLPAYAATAPDVVKRLAVTPANQVSNASKNSAARDSLTQLKEKISAPLYDPKDPLVINASKSITPTDLKNVRVQEPDRIGARQIEENLAAFKAKHPNAEVVVVYSGAGVHSWLAIDALKKKGFNYISAARQPLDTKLMERDSVAATASDRQSSVKRQLVQEQRVLGQLGFQNYKQFYDAQVNAPTKGRDVFIGIDETGLHGATGVREAETGRGKTMFGGISDYVAERTAAGKQVAVLYLGEGLNASVFRQDFDTGRFRPDIDSRDILFSSEGLAELKISKHPNSLSA